MHNDNMDIRLLETSPSPGSRQTVSPSGVPNDYDDAVPDTQSEHVRSTSFLKLLSLWIGTILFTALVVAIALVYQAKGVLTSTEKTTCNVLITVLILILGLSFFVGSPPSPSWLVLLMA